MRLFNTMFLLLFGYIVAALIFWGFSLQQQSERIYEQEMISLRQKVDSLQQPETFIAKKQQLEDKRNRRRSQYLGEGSSFLLVILIGAAVVYSSFRRSIRLSKQQNNFMLAVTHELKSPIAAVKLNLQTLEKYQLDEEKKSMLIDRTIKESSRLNDLCNNMLLASQIEGKQYQSTKERLSFAELAEQVVADYSARYPGRFIGDFDSAPEDVFVQGDRLMLQMTLNNLLENAVKYAPADKPVVVRLTVTNQCAVLQVKDEGIGIPDEEKAKVFRKFYRVGNENTRRTKGTGLGLYLVKKIVTGHKGKIMVKDNQPQGTCFELQLPVA